MRAAAFTVALLFIALLGVLTALELARHGITVVGVLAVLVLALFMIAIVGSLREPPEQ